MKIFLLWQRGGDPRQRLDPERVASHLQTLFSPLFGTPPTAKILQNSAMSMVLLELPVRGWRLPSFQEDAQTWALALDYPIDARTALAADGTSFDADCVLPTLCRKLQEDPRRLLRGLAPPFSLIWSSKQTGETFVQNDGLGQSQLFEFQGDRLWALTNKVVALKALGAPLEMESGEWAVRSTLGWFPLDMTGYKRIRFVRPATQFRLDSQGWTSTTHDVLSEWLHPNGLSPDDCLELARCSLLRQIKEVMPFCEEPSVGLSGGWDTRAVVSSLRALGVVFSPRVRGLPGRCDVLVASELARVAGLDLSVHHAEGLPPEDPNTCRRSISLALLWQAGYMETLQHKTFLSDRASLDGGVVNVMGQHGEIGRGYYAKRIRATSLREGQYEEQLIAHLMKRLPPFTRTRFHDFVHETLRRAYRQADAYGLTGLARLDFFYLYERTRRWASGSLSSQPGLVVAPFLNPDYIRATFGYSGLKETNPFHRHIIAINSPDWATVPYSNDLEKREFLTPTVEPQHGSAPSSPPPSWKRPKGNHNYDSSLYWVVVGKAIIDEALSRGGFWTEIFDPDVAREQWQAAPDQLAITYVLPHALQR